ncbi:MAG: hypothetical protein WBW33_28250 [Bryobacteraceae bacterium]
MRKSYCLTQRKGGRGFAAWDLRPVRHASQEAAWQKHTEAMSEFDEKLNALIDIVGRMQGGMETRRS